MINFPSELVYKNGLIDTKSRHFGENGQLCVPIQVRNVRWLVQKFGLNVAKPREQWRHLFLVFLEIEWLTASSKVLLLDKMSQARASRHKLINIY